MVAASRDHCRGTWTRNSTRATVLESPLERALEARTGFLVGTTQRRARRPRVIGTASMAMDDTPPALDHSPPPPHLAHRSLGMTQGAGGRASRVALRWPKARRIGSWRARIGISGATSTALRSIATERPLLGRGPKDDRVSGQRGQPPRLSARSGGSRAATLGPPRSQSPQAVPAVAPVPRTSAVAA